MLPKKVLIIDDEKMIRLTTSMLLKRAGIENITAANGKDGLRLLSEEKPDVLLLDIMMPVMDGWEVLSSIKANSLLVLVTIVIFTAGDYTESIKRAEEMGVRYIIRKPFRNDELLTALESAFMGEINE